MPTQNAQKPFTCHPPPTYGKIPVVLLLSWVDGGMIKADSVRLDKSSYWNWAWHPWSRGISTQAQMPLCQFPRFYISFLQTWEFCRQRFDLFLVPQNSVIFRPNNSHHTKFVSWYVDHFLFFSFPGGWDGIQTIMVNSINNIFSNSSFRQAKPYLQ